MKPSSIAYLIGSLETGGAEGQVIELLRHLDRTKFDPRLILFDPATSPRASGLVEDVFALDIPRESSGIYGPRGYRSLKAFLLLCRYLRRTRPNVLHAHLPASCILGLPAGRLCRIPVVMGSRRSLTASYRSAGWIYSLADQLITRVSPFMVGNAEAVTREIVEIDGVPAAKTATIYNGADTERFRPGGSDFWRDHYGWRKEEVVFGMVANFFSNKRHIDFVGAAAILYGRYPQARFVMAGKDRGAASAVQAAIARGGLSKVVQLVPSTSRPEDLYAAMDVLVCCSDGEGFSNVILEAMACGKPVIATAVGGNVEAVVDGSTGFLVPRRSPLAVAHAAERLARDKALRQSMGRNARQRVEERFSVLKMVRAHERLYAHLLEQSGCQASPGPEISPQRAIPVSARDTFISLGPDSRVGWASTEDAEHERVVKRGGQ